MREMEIGGRLIWHEMEVFAVKLKAHLAHKETTEDDSVESRVSPSGKEAVKLFSQLCPRRFMLSLSPTTLRSADNSTMHAIDSMRNL